MMDGISLTELEQRYSDCSAARVALHRDFETKDTGYAYVLGELESLIEIIRGRQAAARAEAERLEAERLLTTLADAPAEAPEAGETE
jgi:hypothetical protein